MSETTRHRTPVYRATDHIVAPPGADAYTRPAFSLSNRAARLVWGIVWLLLYRTSPRPFHAWRSLLLRLFGAKLGTKCHFYPGSKVWAPWNLHCADQVTTADGVEIYNPALIECGSHVIFSQGSYICGATHDYNDPAFPLLAYRMSFGAYAWICARACVAPGVQVSEGSVLGLASVATRDLEPWTVYAGVPAKAVKQRERFLHGGDAA
ncbi:putative colanic acid biosynthesis acetyltransferase [Granulicella sp. 5B5]|uniref:putative colanic acid biosynthesis acetyltransferase n=1 Tax=Granulicella sp. 5B5 TaxID=1617967 RepID=UPI0015F39F73|nr:putative colanic acid biosynthesis acetyltransferase [Granulicella sp. 5B5]QMV19565.1 putative colanic acid biosynthesis acetyltransferase [Granulicella sp. 5B5]